MHAWPTPQVPELPGYPSSAPVRVHDSSTGELVEAAPGRQARLYACGITPYDATHIGHANTYVAFDLLVRAWLDAGKEVVYTSNVTDVDDPLLERATATGVDWRELAASQVALFREDMTALGVVPPRTWTGAVDSVPDVARAVVTMLESGAAYRVPLEAGAGGATPELGDVYADLTADPHFGTVAHLDREQALATFAERGGDPDREGKKDPLDPLLWRRERPGEPTWDGGPLGTGRPGWHIECAVIARDGLDLAGGERFDVQGGGCDLLFPHHEMSTSHLRVLCANAGGDAPQGPVAARTHVHAGLVAYDGEKMSKSLGNLVLVSGLREAGHDPMAIRLALLAHHYRTEWEWDETSLPAGEARLARWRDAVSGNGGPSADATLARVRAALADDLDAPSALAAVDAWAEASLEPGRDTSQDEEGAPGVLSRAVNALLGVRI
ncbi:cysteine--1-D-myo-inosityl 2-amino-2-deoxy-alpha-D-glucopyranoside ligase [Promicromonospora thailandica]|uniref:L-cysteine:1D-myo-inositol 2-amino-2-deoxy-alpha-D-glucopyranoside ligase n=1 Tax=Promicromonospora thailandica TaxID=765201 RepID=A0A9X2G430_9MICO|nr:cysteine--1-D-myo-inosityl 2-amino-2-deoxy-alpha-D-glucopyranoside ligase [Promicromonospora thailandica]MCP2266737.1 L-cysteine:1D-myo-inositol 2-amino-2-deoxy-alpha-D-glucopyranoside ligase [Promicromonospora thailandica]